MNYLKLIPCLLLLMVLTESCKFKKGDLFKLKTGEDTLIYVLAAKGSGSKISDKVLKMKLNNEAKGDTCNIRYLGDSVSISKKKVILLFNSTAPDISTDMLSKGFFGAFTSKQKVSYLILSYDDMEELLKKAD